MPGRKFPIDFHHSVGPIGFGKSRSEIEAAMGKTPERRKRRKAIAEYDYFKDEGFFVYYDPSDTVMAAEFFELGEVYVPPDTSLAVPYDALMTWIRSRDPNVTVEAEGDFRSNELGLAGRPKQDESGEVESIVVFRPNYYEDTQRFRKELGL
jgi:hypothetical protein